MAAVFSLCRSSGVSGLSLRHGPEPVDWHGKAWSSTLRRLCEAEAGGRRMCSQELRGIPEQSLDVCLDDGRLSAHRWNGLPITVEHGRRVSGAGGLFQSVTPERRQVHCEIHIWNSLTPGVLGSRGAFQYADSLDRRRFAGSSKGDGEVGERRQSGRLARFSSSAFCILHYP